MKKTCIDAIKIMNAAGIDDFIKYDAAKNISIFRCYYGLMLQVYSRLMLDKPIVILYIDSQCPTDISIQSVELTPTEHELQICNLLTWFPLIDHYEPKNRFIFE